VSKKSINKCEKRVKMYFKLSCFYMYGSLLTTPWPLFHEILRQILKSKPHYRAHKIQKLDSVVSQIKPDHVLILYASKSTCSGIWYFCVDKHLPTFRRTLIIAVVIPSSSEKKEASKYYETSIMT
jgi:hypothetical protein